MKQIKVNTLEEYTNAVKLQVAKFATTAADEDVLLSAILIVDNGREYVTEMIGSPRFLDKARQDMKKNIFGVSAPSLPGLIIMFALGVSFGIWVCP